MALFGIDEEQSLKKQLRKSAKKGNLRLIGVVLGVLVLVLVFTMVDFGNLFKGNILDEGVSTKECYTLPNFSDDFNNILKLETISVPILEQTPESEEVCTNPADPSTCETYASEGNVKYYDLVAMPYLYYPVLQHDEPKIIKFTEAAASAAEKAEATSCRLKEIADTKILCQEILNTVEYAKYEPEKFSQSTKEELEKMVNETLSCPTALGCGEGQLIDFFYQNYQNPFKCYSPTVAVPQIKEHKINLETFDPSPKWGESIVITYSVDIISSVKLQIIDSNGVVVAERDKQIPLHFGDEYTWDGKTKTGEIAAPGTYTYKLTASNAGGSGNIVSGTFVVGGSGYLKYCMGKVGQVTSDKKKLCTKVGEYDEWKFCVTNGEKSTDGKYTCTAGEWLEGQAVGASLGKPTVNHHPETTTYKPAEGVGLKFIYTPDQDVEISLNIIDPAGATIHTYKENVKKEVTDGYEWNGKLSDGKFASPGAYFYTITAKNTTGEIFQGKSGFTILGDTVTTQEVPTVKVYADKVSFNPEKGEKITFTYTPDQSATIKLKIFNSTSTEVHTFEGLVSKDTASTHVWDGKKADGTIAPPGTYTYNVKAISAAGESVATGGGFQIEANQQANVTCTENQVTDGATKLCKNGEWIACIENGTFDGSKSTDEKLTCAGGKWIDLSTVKLKEETEPEKTDCVENNLMINGKRICKGSVWLPCTASNEGEKSSDALKVCSNGLWVKASKVTSAPIAQPPAQPPSSSGVIQITKAKAFPIGFNPLINETKISYAISGKAEVEIKILTKSGVTIATIVDNKVLDAGEYFIWWDGKGSTGKTVDPATYEFKITAKDPNSGTVKDVKKGELNVVYAKLADFETPPPAPQQPQVSTQSAATMAMTNATSGSTADTGPGVLLYFLFPIGSFIITRRKKYFK